MYAGLTGSGPECSTVVALAHATAVQGRVAAVVLGTAWPTQRVYRYDYLERAARAHAIAASGATAVLRHGNTGHNVGLCGRKPRLLKSCRVTDGVAIGAERCRLAVDIYASIVGCRAGGIKPARVLPKTGRNLQARTRARIPRNQLRPRLAGKVKVRGVIQDSHEGIDDHPPRESDNNTQDSV